MDNVSLVDDGLKALLEALGVQDPHRVRVLKADANSLQTRAPRKNRRSASLLQRITNGRTDEQNYLLSLLSV